MITSILYAFINFYAVLTYPSLNKLSTIDRYSLHS